LMLLCRGMYYNVYVALGQVAAAALWALFTPPLIEYLSEGIQRTDQSD
jgi:hypothetical protein